MVARKKGGCQHHSPQKKKKKKKRKKKRVTRINKLGGNKIASLVVSEHVIGRVFVELHKLLVVNFPLHSDLFQMMFRERGEMLREKEEEKARKVTRDTLSLALVRKEGVAYPKIQALDNKIGLLVGHRACHQLRRGCHDPHVHDFSKPAGDGVKSRQRFPANHLCRRNDNWVSRHKKREANFLVVWETLTLSLSFVAARRALPSGVNEVPTMGARGSASVDETCLKLSRSQNLTHPSAAPEANKNSLGWKSIAEIPPL